MSKILIALVVVLVLVGAYFLWPAETNNYQVFNSPELGLQFTYPAGYVLKVAAGADGNSEFIQSLVLMTAEDAATPPPVGGEGPATITVQVLKNTLKQWPLIWAETHLQFSNLNLKIGEVSEAVVGGAKAVRYLADGLYATDTVVVAHGENIYIFSGMFINEDSALRRDFGPLVDSVAFIRQPNQE